MRGGGVDMLPQRGNAGRKSGGETVMRQQTGVEVLRQRQRLPPDVGGHFGAQIGLGKVSASAPPPRGAKAMGSMS
jgi:hypothetical protein